MVNQFKAFLDILQGEATKLMGVWRSMLAIVLVTIGLGLWWHYERVEELEKENARFGEVIGTKQRETVYPLIRLTDTELRAKGMRSVQLIRAINSYHQEQMIALNSKLRKREVTEIQYQEQRELEAKRVTDELTSRARADALMVYDELVRRVPGAARPQIGLPHLNPADKRDDSVSLYRAFLDFGWSGLLANNIEELVKALEINPS